MKVYRDSRPASVIALATPGTPGPDVIDADQIRLISN